MRKVLTAFGLSRKAEIKRSMRGPKQIRRAIIRSLTPPNFSASWRLPAPSNHERNKRAVEAATRGY